MPAVAVQESLLDPAAPIVQGVSRPFPALYFFVAGKPQTAGSKTAVPMGGRYGVIEAGNAKTRAAKKTWRGDLRHAAAEAIEMCRWAMPAPDEGLALTVVIVRARPSGHLGTGRNAGIVKPRCVGLRPVARPDTVKLVRAAEDALAKVAFLDDSQIVEHHLFKIFGDQLGRSPYTEGIFVCVDRCGSNFALPSHAARLITSL